MPWLSEISDDAVDRAARTARRPWHARRSSAPACWWANRSTSAFRAARLLRREIIRLGADAGSVRRPQRLPARNGASYAGIIRAELDGMGSARGCRRLSSLRSRTTRISPARSSSTSARWAAKASASSSTPATPSRSAKRRSILRGGSHPMSAMSTSRTTACSSPSEGYRLVRCAIGDGAVPFRRAVRHSWPSTTIA